MSAKRFPIRMQQGGDIKMKPKGTDTVPAMLTPGEFVLNRGAVESAGRPFLHYLNELGKSHPAMMQKGGPVKKKTFPVKYMVVGGPTASDGWGVEPGDIWGQDWSNSNFYGLAISPPGMPGGQGTPGTGVPNLNVPSGGDAGTPSLGGFPMFGGPGVGGDPREIFRRGMHGNRIRHQHFAHLAGRSPFLARAGRGIDPIGRAGANKNRGAISGG